jgi:hypothetical protein
MDMLTGRDTSAAALSQASRRDAARQRDEIEAAAA